MPLYSKKSRVKSNRTAKMTTVRANERACSPERPGKFALKLSQNFCHQGTFAADGEDENAT
jgi:hypothetical protein